MCLENQQGSNCVLQRKSVCYALCFVVVSQCAGQLRIALTGMSNAIWAEKWDCAHPNLECPCNFGPRCSSYCSVLLHCTMQHVALMGVGVNLPHLTPTPVSISMIISCVARVAACDQPVRMHTTDHVRCVCDVLCCGSWDFVHVADIVKLPWVGVVSPGLHGQETARVCGYAGGGCASGLPQRLQYSPRTGLDHEYADGYA